MNYLTTNLTRWQHWKHFATDSGMIIDNRGHLFLWVNVPLHFKAVIETI